MTDDEMLALAHLTDVDFPRFRGCERYDDFVVVATRLGGDNREEYEVEIDKILDLPHCESMWEEETHMYFKFRIQEIPHELSPRSESAGSIPAGAV